MKDSELKEYMEFLPDDVLAAGNKYLDGAENAAPDVNSSAEVKQPKTNKKPARDGRKFRVWRPVLLGVIVLLCVAAGIVLAVKLPKQPGNISEPATVANTPDDTEMIANTPVPTIDPDGLRITGSIILGVPEAYGQTDREALAKYVEAFRKQCPYVEVETRIISSAEAALKAEAGSPDYADVVFFPGEEAFEYAYVDHTLMLLDDIANQTGVKDDIHSGVYESCTVSGNLYAMGTNCDPLLLIYNKDAIEVLALANEVGGSWTFDEFCKLCRTIGQSGEDFAGAQLDFKYEPLFLSLLRVCSGREIKSWAIPERCSVEYVTRVRKDTGSSVAWYDKVRNVVLQELYDLSYAYTDGYNSILPAKDVFDGVNNVQSYGPPQTVMDALDSRMPVFYAALLSELYPYVYHMNTIQVSWDVAPFPLTSQKGTNSGTAVATDCFGIRANVADSSNALAAKTFVAFAWTEEGQTVLNSARGTLPALTTLDIDRFLQDVKVVDTTGKNFAACVPAKGQSVPASLSCYVPSKVSTYMRTEMKTMAGKAISVKSSIEDLLDRMETMATQNYWMRYN